MTRFLFNFSAFLAALALLLWLAGYHIVWKPTEDQLYGCTAENEAPNGECK
jgi:hypothetical protein